MQTVKEDRKHKDCKWRGRMSGEEACVFMMMTGRRRGSEISDCDKYEPGRIETVSTLGGMKHKK